MTEPNKEVMGNDLPKQLMRVYESLTPGAIDHADLDGMAFCVQEAATALQSARAEIERLTAPGSAYEAGYMAGELKWAEAADKQAVEIERLRAALKQINEDLLVPQRMKIVARQALEQSHGQ